MEHGRPPGQRALPDWVLANHGEEWRFRQAAKRATPFRARWIARPVVNCRGKFSQSPNASDRWQDNAKAPSFSLAAALSRTLPNGLDG